ncbi:MAG TPA: glycosyl transferase family 1 [Chloroflexus aurantiacus]|jgi:glycosyltransferase involved in cell wall biosynthesis|uniref:Glycosyl transferase group 1 n=1 Tax=Chloroflexus aurantiacus (strain ATCC 29366 / DSM 635 / J-10-fl) TaxID=324602 RepID=A9WC21_CHLAA|nr:glycosyltransferase [Chloroflexus aurantiacus]ABY33414.1 glycosyl transferase group 1 [Chloroflexus aurantiacus J-10-fl]RMG52528.1 MAG: glycosyltransferase [Chloroflexota bacterium]HBW66121.1 glycosyl transferase family 1 [Chloroflexus aurantiacus]
MALRIAFLTVGDPQRRTGGYLYHREVFRCWQARNQPVEEIVLGPADVAGQIAASNRAGQLVEAGRYDVIVVDALARAVVAPWLAHWQRLCPLVTLVHELPTVAGASDPREYEWEQMLLRADALVAVSDDGANTLIARGVEAARIHIASGGCDRLLSRMPVGKAREELVIAVAQWIPRKNLAHLVRVWGQVAEHPWRLELIGESDADPVYAGEVWQAIQHCPANVIVRGVLADDELAERYARASLFALPSRFEGYGLVFAEALACGLPVIAGAVGPVPALVGAGGMLVHPDDEQALSVALRTVMRDAHLRQHLSTAARQRASTLPRWQDTAQHLLCAIEWAYAQRHRVST